MHMVVSAGVLRLEQFECVEFGLERINEAVQHAAEQGGPYKLTVLRFGSSS